MENLRRVINSTFTINGLSINSEGITYLHGILSEFDARMQAVWLEKIIDKVQRQPLTSSLISKDIVEIAARECGRGEAIHEDIITVISAFDVPKLTYDVERKKFLPCMATPELLGDAVDKPLVWRNRHAVLLQRTLHHELFTPTLQGLEWTGEKKKFNLKSIEYLIGTNGKESDIVVLGMITQMKEGRYFLEDTTGTVEIDMTNTKFHTGFYTEGCYVLAEGKYEDKIYTVNAMGLPPAESAKISRAYYGSTNFFGGSFTEANRERLQILEKEHEDDVIVILSDVHLDRMDVLSKLRVLFEGVLECIPPLFIFMGNFLSEPFAVRGSHPLRNALNNLADLLSEFPMIIEKSKFLFVPGPLDPGFVNILPRPPIADVITKYFREKVPSAIFASNPCRIRYCTKEIVVFREDIFTKLCRNALFFQKEGALAGHFVKTIVGQSHLTPLPLHMCPVYWGYDHALSLYPLPDLVIIGDKREAFNIIQNGCTFINPGHFSGSGFGFKSYSPYHSQVDDCVIPHGDAAERDENVVNMD